MACLFLLNNAKEIFNHESKAKKQIRNKVKKKAGRKRKYDIISQYSDINEDINNGKKIFKICKHTIIFY